MTWSKSFLTVSQESPVVDTDQDQNVDEDCENNVVVSVSFDPCSSTSSDFDDGYSLQDAEQDAEGQGSLNEKRKSRSRGHSWWLHRKPRENHRNRGKLGWERREAINKRAPQQANAEASTGATRSQ